MRTTGLSDRIVYVLLGAALVAFIPILYLGMALAAVLNAVTAPFVERVSVRRWQQSPKARNALPGLPGWTDREQRAADLIAAIEQLPVERFDGFDAAGIADWTPIYDVARSAPREVRNAVEAVRWSASNTVVRRAQRDRPEAGGEDYALHNAWFLYEPHWEAAERAAVAGATAILLEGHLDDAMQADWTAGVTRLVGQPLRHAR